MPDPSLLLKCKEKVDIVVLLDGSGSLRSDGWKLSQHFAETFVNSLEGGDELVKAALVLFSGPRTWTALQKCYSDDPGVVVDLEADCGVTRVKEFTNDTAAVAEAVAGLEWPAATTATSIALAQAEQMFAHGREDAKSLVVVITDGWPMSQYATTLAANRLKEHANVLWVPVGAGAPMHLIEELASLPKEDHIVKVNAFRDLAIPDKINQIMSTACAELEFPSE